MKRVRPVEQVVPADTEKARKHFQSDDLGVTFYSHPPDAEVSVRQFEDYTARRLKLLHTIDRACSGAGDPLEQMRDVIRPKLGSEFRESGLELGYPETRAKIDTFLAEKAEFQRRDHISHFALRLALCKSEARDWFLRQEQRLFVLRFEALSADARESFLGSEGIECNRFAESDFQGKVTLKMLQTCTPGAKMWVEKGMGRVPELQDLFYVMPFTEVPEKLISGRRVMIFRGQAFVPANLLKLVITRRFKESLARALDVAFQGQHAALMDPRVGGFIRVLQDYGLQLVAGPASSEELTEKLSLANFEEVMPRSFPPCMRRLVEKQRETKKHLKHAGRLQLRPFLKACGFTFEDSCHWWKKELCQDAAITSENFEKSYLYDMEHAYGKKGHRQGQSCFGCAKIIAHPGEAAGQVHGCLFTQEPSALRNQLQRWQVPPATVMEIQRLIKEGKHYQLACIEYFISQHPSSDGEGVGNSPVDFFKSSCRFHKNTKETPKSPQAITA